MRTPGRPIPRKETIPVTRPGACPQPPGLRTRGPANDIGRQVWVIDAKHWEGTVSYRSRSFFDVRLRLFVGHDDRTRAVEDIYKLVIPVANALEDPSVPLHPAVVFVEANWSLRLLFRWRP